MFCTYAGLNESSVDEIKTLEKKLGKTLLAFKCREVGLDQISQNELQQIENLEKKLGVSLVAVR